MQKQEKLLKNPLIQENPKKIKNIFPRGSLSVITLFFIVVLSIVSFFSYDSNTWTTQELDHFYFELFSVILAAIAATYCISRGLIANEKFSLFLGIGFLVAGTIDFLHGFFSISNYGLTSTDQFFMPQTWVASRIVFGAMIMVAIIKFSSKNELDHTSKKNIKKKGLTYAIGLTGLGVGVSTISLIQPFPYIVIDFFITRPYDLGSAIFFIFGLFIFCKNKLHRKKDPFFLGVYLILLFSIFVNLVSSYSSALFDTAFSMAHTLKITGLSVFIFTLIFSAVYNFTHQKTINKKLEEKQNELKQVIAEKEKFASMLKTIDKQKEEFQSMISHELKTPLTPIIGYAEALKIEKIMGTLSEKQLNSVNKISKNAERLKKLIGDIFDAHKLDLGKMKFEFRPVLISELIKDVIEDFKFSAEEKNIKIFSSSTEGIIIKSDRNRLIQVLGNLLKNAIDFVPKQNGIIKLNVKEENDFITFTVEDNGEGIPKELQKNLFQKFYQIDSSSTRSHGGTGLGLTICRGIVENLGGKIWLESQINKGSKFFVMIPIDHKNGGKSD